MKNRGTKKLISILVCIALVTLPQRCWKNAWRCLWNFRSNIRRIFTEIMSSLPGLPMGCFAETENGYRSILQEREQITRRSCRNI